jgi:hypothetical protein
MARAATRPVADEYVPRSGMSRLKTSQARTVKYASSP